MNNFNKLTDAEMTQVCGGNPPRVFKFIKSAREESWIKRKDAMKLVLDNGSGKTESEGKMLRYVY